MYYLFLNLSFGPTLVRCIFADICIDPHFPPYSVHTALGLDEDYLYELGQSYTIKALVAVSSLKKKKIDARIVVC